MGNTVRISHRTIYSYEAAPIASGLIARIRQALSLRAQRRKLASDRRSPSIGRRAEYPSVVCYAETDYNYIPRPPLSG